MQWRYVIAWLGCVATTLIYVLRIHFGVAIVCMTHNAEFNSTNVSVSHQGEFSPRARAADDVCPTDDDNDDFEVV